MKRGVIMAYRLPDGTETKLGEEYANAWIAFSGKVCEAFGGELNAFDPGVAIVVDDGGRPRYLSIPAWAVRRFNEQAENHDRTIDVLDAVVNPTGACLDFFGECENCNETECPWDEGRSIVKKYRASRKENEA